MLSVLQYFVAEAAVIGAWAGPRSRTAAGPATSATWAPWTAGFLTAGTSARRPHLLMNASFVVQGLGMLLGALLLGSGLLCCAARPGAPSPRPGGPSQSPARAAGAGVAAAAAARLLTGTAGAGTVIVGLVPEDTGSAWHYAGALMYFAAGRWRCWCSAGCG